MTDTETIAETIAELRAKIAALNELNAGLRVELRRVEDEFARHFLAAAREVWEQNGGPIKLHFGETED